MVRVGSMGLVSGGTGGRNRVGSSKSKLVKVEGSRSVLGCGQASKSVETRCGRYRAGPLVQGGDVVGRLVGLGPPNPTVEFTGHHG